MARPEAGDAKPRWPWTEGISGGSNGSGATAGSQTATAEAPVAVATKPRRFWRGLRHEQQPEGVTWLGESRVVKALEEAEAHAHPGHGPAAPPSETTTPAVAAYDSGEPTDPVPLVTEAPVAEAATSEAATAEPPAAVSEEPVTEPAEPVAPDEGVPVAAAGAIAGRRPRGLNPLRRKKILGETSPLGAAGAMTAAVAADEAASQERMVTDTATEEQAAAEDLGSPPRRRFGWLGSKQVATAVAVILAAEVGYIVHLNTSSTSETTPRPQALPKLTVPAPASSLPSASLPVTTPTTAAPATKAASAPPVTAPAHPALVSAPATTPAPAPTPCTASELSFTTTTDRSSYTAGQPVVVVTKVTSLASCVFTPTPPPGASCATSISVDHAGGGPAPMGPESCTPPAGSTLNPGATETVTATLPAGELAPGAYTAVGAWGWSTGQGVATAAPASASFTIS